MSTSTKTPIVLAFSGGLDTSYCVLELKAQGFDVKIGGELFSDAMGASGTKEGTYIGMVQHNI